MDAVNRQPIQQPPSILRHILEGVARHVGHASALFHCNACAYVPGEVVTAPHAVRSCRPMPVPQPLCCGRNHMRMARAHYTPIPPYPHTPIPLVTATWNILCDNRVRMWVDPMCARVCYEPSWSWKSTAVDAMHMQHTHQISFVFPTRLRAHSSSFFWHSVSRKYCQQLEHTTSAPESFSRVCESALFITYTSSGGCLPAHLQ
jgi:hypothetical protein